MATLAAAPMAASAEAHAAGPMPAPASALGRSGHAAPGDRITLGFIGCGKMANDYHLPTLLGFADIQALAVCDVDPNRRAHARQRVQEAYAKDGRTVTDCAEYSDFRELLARRDIDAVVIATPEHWHAIPIIEACKAGKDVYCEKPLTLTLAESKRCMEAVRKHKRVLQTGSQQRSNVFGDFRQACEFVRSGRSAPLPIPRPSPKLDRLHPLPRESHLRRRDRVPLRCARSTRQPRLLAPPAAEMEPREVALRRRPRSQRLARPRPPRSLETAGGLT